MENDTRSPSNPRKDTKPLSLLVRNITFNTTGEDLRNFFGGDKQDLVKDVYMPKDYHTGKPRGFAFVEFYDEEEAMEAMKDKDGAELDGREIGVIVAQERRKTPDQMRDLDPGHRRRRSRSPRRRSRSPRHRRSPDRRNSRRSRSNERRHRSPRRRSPERRSRRRSPSRSKSRSRSRNDDRR